MIFKGFIKNKKICVYSYPAINNKKQTRINDLVKQIGILQQISFKTKLPTKIPPPTPLVNEDRKF